MNELVSIKKNNDSLAHYGIQGMKWGVRRYQNPDGTLTPMGRDHYGYDQPRNIGRFTDKGEVIDLSPDAISADYDAVRKSDMVKDAKTIESTRKTSDAALDKIKASEEKAIPSKDMESVNISTVNNDFWNSLAQHQMRDVKDNKELLDIKNSLKHPEKLTNEQKFNYFGMIARDVNVENFYRKLYTANDANGVSTSNHSIQEICEKNEYVKDAKAGYFQNCPMTSLASELRSRGYNATAGNIATAHGATGLPHDDIRRMYTGVDKAYNAGKNYELGRTKSKMSKSVGYDGDNQDLLCISPSTTYTKRFNGKLEKQISKATFRSNERYIALWPGHISNAYTNSDGKLFINDGQVGIKDMDIVKYMKSMDAGGGFLVRVDDKKLNTDFIKKFTGGTYNNQIIIK